MHLLTVSEFGQNYANNTFHARNTKNIKTELTLIFIGVTGVRPYFVSFCVCVYVLFLLCWRCYCIIISDDPVIGHFAVNSARAQELNYYDYR